MINDGIKGRSNLIDELIPNMQLECTAHTAEGTGGGCDAVGRNHGSFLSG